MRRIAHSVIIAALLGSAAPGLAAEPPASAPTPPTATAPPLGSSGWQPSKHIGAPGPSPTDLGLTWLKGEAVTAWAKDRPTVLVYEPPIKDHFARGWSPRPELWLRQLMRESSATANILQVVPNGLFPFTLSIDAPIVNWPIARADWGIVGPRLTDNDDEGYPHILVIDVSGRIAWIGGLRTSDAAYVVSCVVDGSFDAAAHAARLRRANELNDQLRKALMARDENAADAALEELRAVCPWRRAELGRERVRLLVDRHRIDEATAFAENLITGDCSGDFASLQELDRDLFSAGVLRIGAGGNADGIKSLRARTMSAAADALDQADAQSNAEAAKRYAEMNDWDGAVRWQSLALSYAAEDRRDEYQKTLQSYIDRLEGRTPPEDTSPMFRRK